MHIFFESKKKARRPNTWDGQVQIHDEGGQFARSERQREQAMAGQGPQKLEPIRNVGVKIGRNDPCPCGSGKKYKKCHGRGG